MNPESLSNARTMLSSIQFAYKTIKQMALAEIMTFIILQCSVIIYIKESNLKIQRTIDRLKS